MKPEKYERDQERYHREIRSLLDVLNSAHYDNTRLHYYAKFPWDDNSHKIMPLTTFIFELFIYNSLYQYDWEQTLSTGRLSLHPRSKNNDIPEREQQRALEDFLKEHMKDSKILIRSFHRIGEINIDGDWTHITPDSRISKKKGEDFFNSLRTLQGYIKTFSEKGNTENMVEMYELIGNRKYFVYLVRNNIFHGSKPLAEATEKSQEHRIEVYKDFITCLNSMSFNVMNDLFV